MERVVLLGEQAMTNQPVAALPSAINDYVLPVPPRQAGEVVVVGNSSDPQSSLRRGGQVARALGDHILAIAESQQQFLAELRDRLQQVDVAIADATRAQLKGALREVVHVLDWVDSVQAELAGVGRRAAAGAELVDVADVCAVVAAQVRAEQRQVDVSGAPARAWWGEAAALHEAVQKGVALVTERTGGLGVPRITIEESDGVIRVCITSSADPVDTVDAATVQRFRSAVERIGAKVRPDAMGPGGSGLVIELVRGDS